MAPATSDLTTVRLAALLTDPDHRVAAALELGRRRAREHSAAILAAMPAEPGRDRAAFVVALEEMGDPSVVPALRPMAGDWDVHHALVRLTGRDPLVTDPRDPAARQRAWADLDLDVPALPRVEVSSVTATRADLTVDDGLGRLRIDYDSPTGSVWPRWGRSLLIDGVPVYRVGSLCGTCETTIALTGWPSGEVAAVSARLRDRLADPRALDQDLVDALTPMLVAMPSGHYRLYLLDLDLEHVTDPAASWWSRRVDERGDAGADDEPGWPGVEHFQLRQRIPGPVRTYGVVLPSRGQRTAETVATHRAAIDSGARPTALLWGWVEQRNVEMEYPERFLVGVVLDGHHRLTAYAESGVPARVVLVARVEDSWGPPGERDRFLAEVVTPLTALP